MKIQALGGPMFENPNSGDCRSIHGKTGAHYNIYEFHTLATLRDFFPNGKADPLNFVLFSTSGVHGTYTTLEDIEASLTKYGDDAPAAGDDYPDDYHVPAVTVLIVHPRLVCLRYGVVPVTLADLPWLKTLRASSWAVCRKIGAPNG